MELINFVTLRIAILPLLLVVGAAFYVCLKARSWHPVNVRLMRIFVRKDEVKDADIIHAIEEQSALASFRITHAVNSATLVDAKNLLTFANERNVPMHLFGRSGGTFDIRKLEFKKPDGPSGLSTFLISALLMVSLLGTFTFLIAASSDNLLVSLKESGTYLWLGDKQSKTASKPLLGNRIKYSRDDCRMSEASKEDATLSDDHQTLCAIWSDPKFAGFLTTGLREQKVTFAVTSGLLAWWSFILFLSLRSLFAQMELRRLLADTR